MATKRKIILPSNSGTGPSSAIGTEGLFTLPQKVRIHAIGLTVREGATFISGSSDVTAMTSVLGDIIVRVNSKEQRTHSTAELDHANSVNAVEYAYNVVKEDGSTSGTKASMIMLWFAEPWRKDKVDADAMAVTMNAANGVSSAQLSEKLAAAFTGTNWPHRQSDRGSQAQGGGCLVVSRDQPPLLPKGRWIAPPESFARWTRRLAA